MRSRVLLVEDSIPMREAIKRILAPVCELLRYVEDGREVMNAALEMRPDTIVLDISLPGISGINLLPLLRCALPNAAIIMLTSHASEDYMEEAYRRGADAYVLKWNANEALLPAIRRGRMDQHTIAGSEHVALNAR